MFYVKVKVNNEKKSIVSWLEPDEIYSILDIFKARIKDKDTGQSFFETWFLLGNDKSGTIGWVKSEAIIYRGAME